MVNIGQYKTSLDDNVQLVVLSVGGKGTNLLSSHFAPIRLGGGGSGKFKFNFC